jgi:hypothetical protein
VEDVAVVSSVSGTGEVVVYVVEVEVEEAMT